jgi:hypothetical protein
MKDLGPVKWYLGITIERNRSERTIKLSQRAYLEKVLSRFGMLHCDADEIPMTVGQQLQRASSDYEAESEFTRTFQEAIGSLMYLMLCTRSFSANPTGEHWKAVKKVLRYLKEASDAKLVFRGNATHIQGHGCSIRRLPGHSSICIWLRFQCRIWSDQLVIKTIIYRFGTKDNSIRHWRQCTSETWLKISGRCHWACEE